jgi:hypothetical protein
MSLHEDSWPVIRKVDGENEGFEVLDGLHQGPVLSLLQFIVVMEAVT